MSLGTLLFTFKTDWLLSIFNPSKELIEIGSKTLRIISLSFPIAALTISMSNLFQSVGKGFSSMIMSLSRQLIFLIPVAFILGRLWGLDAIWAAYPVSELLVFVIFLPKCIKTVKEAFQ